MNYFELQDQANPPHSSHVPDGENRTPRSPFVAIMRRKADVIGS